MRHPERRDRVGPRPGLLLGIEIAPATGTARDVALRLLERGVLAKDTHRQVLRLAPPLVIDEASIDWLVDQIATVTR